MVSAETELGICNHPLITALPELMISLALFFSVDTLTNVLYKNKKMPIDFSAEYHKTLLKYEEDLKRLNSMFKKATQVSEIEQTIPGVGLKSAAAA